MFQMIQRRLVWILAGYALLVTIFLVWRNPIPLPDRGHRCFAVPSQAAAKAVAGVLGEMGLHERFTFDAGPTQQTLLWDNTTVIILLEQSVNSVPGNAISVPVPDPLEGAQKAAEMLKKRGFSAALDTSLEDKGLVLLTSNAFDHWAMVFRRNIITMGSPPNKRKLLRE